MKHPIKTFGVLAVLAIVFFSMSRYLPVLAFVAQGILLIPIVSLWLAEVSAHLKRDFWYVVKSFAVTVSLPITVANLLLPPEFSTRTVLFGLMVGMNVMPLLHITWLMLREGKIPVPFGHIRVEFAKTGNNATRVFQYKQTLSRTVSIRDEQELPEHIKLAIANYKTNDRNAQNLMTLVLAREGNKKLIGTALHYQV